MAEKKYRIVFDRKNCIGAAACAAVAPEFWVMKDDGKADLIGSKVDENGNQVLLVSENQLSKEGKNVLAVNKDAAEVCPVQVIHIYDDETGEKII
ncbi:MAG: ferredoxin [Candidatus Woesearchaeota archaeon]